MGALLNKSDTDRILTAIADERAAQDGKWGQQNHPDGTGPRVGWAIGFDGLGASEICAEARDTTEVHAITGTVTWLDILLEEVAEAFAEDDPQRLRTELVQVASVAAAWAEHIDRRART